MREYNKQHARMEGRFRRQVKKIHRLRRRQLGTADLDRSIFSTDAFSGLSGNAKARSSARQAPPPPSSASRPMHTRTPSGGGAGLGGGGGDGGSSLPGSPRGTHTWMLGNTPVHRSSLTVTSPSPVQQQQPGPSPQSQPQVQTTHTPPSLNVNQVYTRQVRAHLNACEPAGCGCLALPRLALALPIGPCSTVSLRGLVTISGTHRTDASPWRKVARRTHTPLSPSCSSSYFPQTCCAADDVHHYYQDMEEIVRRVAETVKQDLVQSFSEALEKHRAATQSDTRTLLAECVIRDRYAIAELPRSSL